MKRDNLAPLLRGAVLFRAENLIFP